MKLTGRVFLAADGERYEATLRPHLGQAGDLTFRLLPDGPSWGISVGPHVSLLLLETFELEAWLQVAQGRG